MNDISCRVSQLIFFPFLWRMKIHRVEGNSKNLYVCLLVCVCVCVCVCLYWVCKGHVLFPWPFVPIEKVTAFTGRFFFISRKKAIRLTFDLLAFFTWVSMLICWSKDWTGFDPLCNLNTWHEPLYTLVWLMKFIFFSSSSSFQTCWHWMNVIHTIAWTYHHHTQILIVETSMRRKYMTRLSR